MDRNIALRELAEELRKNPALAEEFKKNPDGVIGQMILRHPIYQGDKWIYRIVVVFLGLTVLSTVIGGLVLKYTAAAELPPALIALGSAGVGALAGLLAPSPSFNRH